MSDKPLGSPFGILYVCKKGFYPIRLRNRAYCEKVIPAALFDLEYSNKFGCLFLDTDIGCLKCEDPIHVIDEG